MRLHSIAKPILIYCAAIAMGVRLMACPPPNCTTNCSDPSSFSTLKELAVSGKEYELCRQYSKVDQFSSVKIHFNNSIMAPPTVDGDKVVVSVEVSIVKDGKVTPVEVQNFVSKQESAAPADPNKDVSAVKNIQFAFHDKPYRPPLFTVPDTTIDLRQIGAAGQDEVVIRIVNLENQDAIVYHLIPLELGWNFKTSDSVMFIQRQGVSKQDISNGVARVNFAASPGVTYGGIFHTRKHGLLNALSPGFGLNVMFLDWKDPAFDSATNTFVKGTSSSDINIGLGVQASLFDGVLQFTYGWNLQADKKRQYLGVGVSFVNIAKALTDLIAQ